MISQAQQLNRLSLSAIRRHFSTLEPPDPLSLHGLHRGLFIGPRWLRAAFGPMLVVTGLGGWWGKEFSSGGNGAINLVIRQGEYRRIFPMNFINQPSHLDGKPGLALRYRPDNPFPWPIILDELRRIDPETVMGMTLVDLKPFQRQAFPFILLQRDTLAAL